MDGLPGGVKVIEGGELDHALNRGEQLSLIDVRPPGAFSKSHLPGAANMPQGSIDELADRLTTPEAAPTIVYGEHDRDERIVDVARELVERGHGQVFIYPGGMREWTQRGRFTTGGEGAPRLK